MKLVSFTVENFRSITKARRIQTSEMTILIGPNNEGKSNILRALVAAMHVLTSGERAWSRGVSSRLFYRREVFDWSRDFPIHLQKKFPNGVSVVILEFGLTDTEVQTFRSEIGSNLNGTLPIRIEIGGNEARVLVAKQGRGAKTLTAKSGRIAQFVANRLDFEHIPAVRTAQSAQVVVDELVERELRVLEDDSEYQTAIKRIAELQRPILDQLSASIKATLLTFLPKLRDVRIEMSREGRYRAFTRNCEVRVDDGVSTLLERKGDGVQSLAALGIMRYASERSGSQRNLVIAIEEPESHLHPRAIHELRAVLRQLAGKHQVVVSTHCPLFINRGSPRSNVLVYANRARPARNLAEVRDILGVRASDNLRHADLVLLVEGDDDRLAVDALLRCFSPTLKAALENGTIAIEGLGGGGNVAYKATLIRDGLCLVHCFLDDDRAGREGFKRAVTNGIISDAEANFATCTGKEDAELEDIYNVDLYSTMISNTYRVNLTGSSFRNRKKWTERMRDTFKKQGKTWDERVETEVKRRVAELVAQNPSNALNVNLQSPFQALVTDLEERLKELDLSRG